MTNPYSGKPPYPNSNTYTQAVLDKYAYLWRTDDQEWMQQREQQWQQLLRTDFVDTPKIEEKLYEGFFKYGKQESYDPKYPKSNYIPEPSLMSFIPVDSAEMTKDIFNSVLFKSGGRERIINDYIYIYDSRIKDHPWLKTQLQYFIQGVMGETYQPIIEIKARREKNIINPEYWQSCYITYAIEALKNNTDYSVVYDCINYFFSLPLAINEDDRKWIKIDKLIETLDTTLNDNSLTGAALEFAQALDQHRQAILDKWAEGEQKMLAEKNKT